MARMSTLRSTISLLAEDFVSQILAALRGASLQDLSAVSEAPSRQAVHAPRSVPTTTAAASQRPTRLAKARLGARRTAADFEKITAAVVELLKKHPDGLRAEQIQKELGLGRKDLPRPMAQALAANLVRKKGEKRATKYFAR